MYKISFETNRANRKVKNWEDELFNDFHKRLDSISYQYKTKSRTLERLKFITHRDNKVFNNKDSYVMLKNTELGKRIFDIKLWGIPQGYVDLESKLLQAEKEGIIKIKLSDFYDIRQNSKILKNAYLVIEYCN